MNASSLIQCFNFSFLPESVLIAAMLFCLLFSCLVLTTVSLPRSLLFWVWVISPSEASLCFLADISVRVWRLLVSVDNLCSWKTRSGQDELSCSRWYPGCWQVVPRRCGLGGFCSGDLLKVLSAPSSCVGTQPACPRAVFCGLDFTPGAFPFFPQE